MAALRVTGVALSSFFFLGFDRRDGLTERGCCQFRGLVHTTDCMDHMDYWSLPPGALKLLVQYWSVTSCR